MEITSKPYLSLLEVFTKMNNVAGLGSSGSQRAMDMRMKIQYINEKNQGRGVIMATGTPLSNSMVELYVMQLYLQERRLHEKGIYHFDAWASVFGEVTSSLELAPEGTGYRMRTRFNKFINLPELIHLFKEVADIILPDMLDIKRPELKDGKYKIVVSEASDYVKERMQEMVKRAEAIHRGAVDPKDDNMLRITGEARLLGTDPRLLDSHAPVDTDSKLNKAVENIYQEYVQSQEQKGTQIVFSDIGTPGPGKPFTVYDYLKHELIAKGIPEEEICFIHDAKTDEQRDRMFSDVRAGRKRIIIGSTEKLGVGTNIQTRMVAAHHIDCPWKPSDIEQREGRIIRQGNENEEVNIYRYVTKGSFDAYLWGIVETKQRFISQVFTSRELARICEDIDETVLNFAEIKAVACGTEAGVFPYGMSLFSSSDVLSKKRDACYCPYDLKRNGMILGEGAGTLVIEELEHALKRNAPIYGEILSFSNNCDGVHHKEKNKNGKKYKEVIESCIRKANISYDEIDYINLDGAALWEDDVIETNVLKEIWGKEIGTVSLSCPKSMFGNTFGAAGALDAIINCLAIKNNTVPPTINYEDQDSNCDLNYTPNKALHRNINTVLQIARGRGGINSAMLLREFKE